MRLKSIERRIKKCSISKNFYWMSFHRSLDGGRLIHYFRELSAEKLLLITSHWVRGRLVTTWPKCLLYTGRFCQMASEAH